MNQTDENPCSLDQARAAKTRARDLLSSIPQVVGIGITRVAGGYGVKVNLSEAVKGIPDRIDQVPLAVEVTGIPKAQ